MKAVFAFSQLLVCGHDTNINLMVAYRNHENIEAALSTGYSTPVAAFTGEATWEKAIIGGLVRTYNQLVGGALCSNI